MKVKEPGHIYELASLDGGKKQRLKFVKRVGKNYPFNELPEHPGTNCQEVLRVLIDRCEYLNTQKACAETESIISLLKTALLLFELRAARHHDRQLDLTTMQELLVDGCDICGHIGCKHVN